VVRDGRVLRIRKRVRYAEIDGQALFEGDIRLGSAREVARGDAGRAEGRATAVVITGGQYRWPLGTLAYEIDPALPDKTRVTDAMAHWSSKTKIRFVERTAANRSVLPDYVRFFDGGGCWSEVGRRGGKQELSIGPTCKVGNVIHEIGHALGLWHEQSREDRNRFVTVHPENVLPHALHNFDQHVEDGDDLGPYDYGSIMHYPRDAFSRNGLATVVPIEPDVEIGQRQALSAGDRKAVAALYGSELAKRPKAKRG
jgi:hypothetical protein